MIASTPRNRAKTFSNAATIFAPPGDGPAQGNASGKRLYVQLESGDSYLKKRKRDEAEVFQIKNPRWADDWRQQAYDVMLVIRTSDGEIRWMDVSTYLRRESDDGRRPVKQVAFEGERFDVMSVRRWRDRVLSGKPA